MDYVNIGPNVDSGIISFSTSRYSFINFKNKLCNN